MQRERIIILGAAGRDFHNFNLLYRNNVGVEVICFTAQQIEGIDSRGYPVELAGPLYPNGIPIFKEELLEKLIKQHRVDTCVLSYSDLSAKVVHELLSRVNAAGANFKTIGSESTMVVTEKPCIAVCAVRTGCGKSQTSRYVIDYLKAAGLRVVVARHPMPYGDLRKQICQRYETYEDLDKYECTAEEREEYTFHIRNHNILYAGVDYEMILREAEKEADVVIWDGGNNDTSFFRSSTLNMYICVADPLRPNHEVDYFPGGINFRLADVILMVDKLTGPNKGSPVEAIESIKANARRWNPKAKVIVGKSVIAPENPELVKDKRVLVIEDGPTCTHGNQPVGAGYIGAQMAGAAKIVDPRPWLAPNMQHVFDKYPTIGPILPCMGYSPEQKADFEETCRRVECDTIVIGTPMNLVGYVAFNKPTCFINYDLGDYEGQPALKDVLAPFVEKCRAL